MTIAFDLGAGGQGARVGEPVVAIPGASMEWSSARRDHDVESHEVTLVHLDRSGAPTANYSTTLVKVDGQRRYSARPSVSGVTTLRVQRGTYILDSWLFEDDDSGRAETVLVRPRLSVLADQALTIDARVGAPVTIDVRVPDGDVAPGTRIVCWSRETALGPLGDAVLIKGPARLFTGQLGVTGSPVRGFTSRVGGVWGERTETGQACGERFTVNLSWHTTGAMITGLDRSVTAADLAVARVRYGATMSGSRGVGGALPHRSGPEAFGGVGLMTALPTIRTEYYNTDGGVTWTPVLEEISPDGEAIATTEGATMSLLPGRRYDVTLNQGVFGPALTRGAPDENGVWRAGDLVSVRIPLFASGAGEWGDGLVTEAGTTLTPNGRPIGERDEYGVGWGDFVVPPDVRRYELTAWARREAPFELSTLVIGVWSFRSWRTPSKAPSPLPLWTIGFAPALGPDNTAAAGRDLTVPLRIESQPGAKVGNLDQIDVEVSFDDGDTWWPRSVTGPEGAEAVSVRHPEGRGFVSLRVSAADSDGNTVEETIMRAYRYAPHPAVW